MGIILFFSYSVTKEDVRLLALLLFLFGIYEREASIQVVRLGVGIENEAAFLV